MTSEGIFNAPMFGSPAALPPQQPHQDGPAHELLPYRPTEYLELGANCHYTQDGVLVVDDDIQDHVIAAGAGEGPGQFPFYRPVEPRTGARSGEYVHAARWVGDELEHEIRARFRGDIPTALQGMPGMAPAPKPANPNHSGDNPHEAASPRLPRFSLERFVPHVNPRELFRLRNLKWAAYLAAADLVGGTAIKVLPFMRDDIKDNPFPLVAPAGVLNSVESLAKGTVVAGFHFLAGQFK